MCIAWDQAHRQFVATHNVIKCHKRMKHTIIKLIMTQSPNSFWGEAYLLNLFDQDISLGFQKFGIPENIYRKRFFLFMLEGIRMQSLYSHYGRRLQVDGIALPWTSAGYGNEE